jgi:outer membrane protein
MVKYIWPSLSALSLIAVLVLIFLSFRQPRHAFVYNDRVFASFKGKIELEIKLKAEQARNKTNLDSLTALMASGRTELQAVYNHTAEVAALREQQLTEKYTVDIWKFINEKAVAFGKDRNYDFIFGAMGDGSLMYAKDQNDITSEFVEYLNATYAGEH